MGRQREMVIRQLAVVEALRKRRRGLTIQQIVETTGASRSTVYRDIESLENARVPITTERIDGEVRYLVHGSRTGIQIGPGELAALSLARQILGALDGTQLVEDLDQLRERACASAGLSEIPPAQTPTQAPIQAPSQGPSKPAAAPTHVGIADLCPNKEPDLVRALDRAVRDGHRIAFDYHGTTDEQPQRRTVDPVSLRMRGRHLYLVAFDPARDDWRLFKVARIDGQPHAIGSADPHPDYDEQTLFAHTAGVWIGDPVTVAIHLDASISRHVTEWPLAADQQLDPQPDGSTIVRARVAGIIEALRWTLSWGAKAEALEPPTLRQALTEELTAAAQKYKTK